MTATPTVLVAEVRGPPRQRSRLGMAGRRSRRQVRDRAIGSVRNDEYLDQGMHPRHRPAEPSNAAHLYILRSAEPPTKQTRTSMRRPEDSSCSRPNRPPRMDESQRPTVLGSAGPEARRDRAHPHQSAAAPVAQRQGAGGPESQKSGTSARPMSNRRCRFLDRHEQCPHPLRSPRLNRGARDSRRKEPTGCEVPQILVSWQV